MLVFNLILLPSLSLLWLPGVCHLLLYVSLCLFLLICIVLIEDLERMWRFVLLNSHSRQFLNNFNINQLADSWRTEILSFSQRKKRSFCGRDWDVNTFRKIYSVIFLVTQIYNNKSDLLIVNSKLIIFFEINILKNDKFQFKKKVVNFWIKIVFLFLVLKKKKKKT